jgi:hypothetical protein
MRAKGLSSLSLLVAGAGTGAGAGAVAGAKARFRKEQNDVISRFCFDHFDVLFSMSVTAVKRGNAYAELAVLVSALVPPKTKEQVIERATTMKSQAKAHAAAWHADQESDLF